MRVRHGDWQQNIMAHWRREVGELRKREIQEKITENIQQLSHAVESSPLEAYGIDPDELERAGREMLALAIRVRIARHSEE
jgi:hypothetical protein